jgi:hypothetical protein
MLVCSWFVVDLIVICSYIHTINCSCCRSCLCECCRHCRYRSGCHCDCGGLVCMCVCVAVCACVCVRVLAVMKCNQHCLNHDRTSTCETQKWRARKSEHGIFNNLRNLQYLFEQLRAANWERHCHLGSQQHQQAVVTYSSSRTVATTVAAG